jgi:disulfide bond formation protein DsbB
MNAPTISRLLNAAGLLAVSLVLIIAFVDQILLRDLPCPLCILERVGFLGAALGLALNVKFGPRASHYAVIILSAFFGALISTRHTLLHIVPGTGTYGDAIMGLHFYTWALVVYATIILGSAIMLLFDRQFQVLASVEHNQHHLLARWFGMVMMVIAAVLALSNGVSTVLECAGGLCPDNPTSYIMLMK